MKYLYYGSKYVSAITVAATFTETLTNKTVAGVVSGVANQLGNSTFAKVAAQTVATSVYGDIQKACYNKLWNIGWYMPDVLLATKEMLVKRDSEAVVETAGYIGGAVAESCGYLVNKGIAYTASTAVGLACPVLASPTYYATNVACEYLGVGRIVSNYVGNYATKVVTRKVIDTVWAEKVTEEKTKVFSMDELDSSQMAWAK